LVRVLWDSWPRLTSVVEGRGCPPAEAEDIVCSCLNICNTVESIMRAYHGVVGGCSRGESRLGGGFTSHSGRLPQQDENPITEPRPKRPRGSGKPRRGAHRLDRPHVTRNRPVAHGESHSSRSWFITHRTSRCSTLRPSRSRWGLRASRNDGVSDDDDIVYCEPEFDLFLPGDTGSVPERWARRAGEFWWRTSYRAHLGRTASRRPGSGKYHFGCTRSAGGCEASAVYTDGGPGGDRR
jgi:hypothetical protein